MAREIASTVRQFLKTQIFRTDYIIVGELPSPQTRLPYAQKLERVHNLCLGNGYREPDACERIRDRLYREENKAGRPVSLLLIESYLPDCIVRISEQDEQKLLRLKHDLERVVRNLPGKVGDVQSSTLDWGGDCYAICLPLDIHFLLIEHDGALLAA
jgi:hypothetical protein